jgi:transcription initiation factor TFIID subunit TAF12
MEGVQAAAVAQHHQQQQQQKKDGESNTTTSASATTPSTTTAAAINPNDPMSFLFDPALVAQYLAQNQAQLQLLQQQQQQLQQQQTNNNGSNNPPSLSSSLSLLPFDLSHPISLSGHLLVPNADGSLSIEQDDKWILSLLNMDTSMAHELSLSGQIPPAHFSS